MSNVTETPDDTGSDNADAIETSTADQQSVDETNVTPATDDQLSGDEGDQSTDDSNDVTNTETDTDNDEYSEFTLPEGVTQEDVDPLIQSLTPIFDEMGLSQEEAQQLLDFQLDQKQKDSQRQSDEWSAQKKQWDETIKADKDLGGANFEKSKGLVDSALNKLGSPELRGILNDSGLIQEPTVFRFLHKLGTLTQEDNPGGRTEVRTEKKDRVSALYPKS